MILEPEAGRPLDLFGGVLKHAAWNHGHIAAALTLHVLVVGADRLVACFAVAEVDPLGVTLLLEPDNGPEHRRIVGGHTGLPQVVLQLVDRPGVMRALAEAVTDGIADVAWAWHLSRLA